MKSIPFVILILAMCPRIILAFTSTESPRYDAKGYDEFALSIAQGKGFSVGGKPTSVRPPFYPFFLAGIYSLFGHEYRAVRIVQACLGALTCLMVFWIARILFTEAVAILSGILAGVYPVLIKSSEHLLTECLFTFLLALAVLCIIVGEGKRSICNAALFGFVLGIATLTRPFLLAFPLCLALLWFGGIGWEKSTLSFRMKRILVVVGVFLLTLLPWTIRNWYVHKAWVVVSTDGGRAFYASYRPPEGKLFGFNPVDEVDQQARRMSSEVERNRFFYQEAFRFIQNRPQELPRLLFLKFLFFWCPFDWELIGGGVYNAMYGFIILFAIAAILKCVKIKKVMTVLAFIFYFQLMAFIFYGSPRFRMPIEPFLIIFAASGLVGFFERHPNKAVTTIVIVSYFFIHTFLFVYSDAFKAFSAHLLGRVGVW